MTRNADKCHPYVCAQNEEKPCLVRGGNGETNFCIKNQLTSNLPA